MVIKKLTLFLLLSIFWICLVTGVSSETLDTATFGGKVTVDEPPAGPSYNWTDWSDYWTFTILDDNHPPNKATSPVPSNGVANINVSSVTFYANVSDPDGGTINATFRWQNTTIIDIDTNVPNQTNATATYSGTLDYSTTYYWYVVTSDGSLTNTSDTWRFTTESEPNYPPNKPNSPWPSDEQTGVAISLNLYAIVTDPDADTIDASFYWQNHTLIDIDNNVNSGAYAYTSLLSLDYNTTYYWYINVSDGSLENQSDVWNFTTRQEPIDNLPEIIDTSDSSGESGQSDFRFSATITDDGTVDIYKVNYSFGGLSYNNVSLQKSGDTYFKEVVVSSDFKGTVYYNISAQDNASQWNQSSGSAPIYDNTNPTLTDNTPQTSIFNTTNLIFNTTCTDNIDVENVFVNYTYNLVDYYNKSMNQVGATNYYTYTLNLNQSGTLWYDVCCNDTSDNWDSDSDSITIKQIYAPSFDNLTVTYNATGWMCHVETNQTDSDIVIKLNTTNEFNSPLVTWENYSSNDVTLEENDLSFDTTYYYQVTLLNGTNNSFTNVQSGSFRTVVGTPIIGDVQTDLSDTWCNITCTITNVTLANTSCEWGKTLSYGNTSWSNETLSPFFNLTSLDNGTLYYYKLTAYNSTNNSYWINYTGSFTTISASPPSLSVFPVTVTDTSFEITFIINQTDAHNVVYVNNTNDFTSPLFTEWDNTSLLVVYVNDTGYIYNTLYYYRVETHNGTNTSLFSYSEGSFRLSCAEPIISNVINNTGVDYGNITLTISNSTDVDTSIEWGYTESYGNKSWNNATLTPYFNLTSLIEYRTYYYLITSYNTTNNSYFTNYTGSFTTQAIPVANFTYEPALIYSLLTVYFNDTSIDNDSNMVNWSWNFDDGNTSYDRNTTHAYTLHGIYNVTLTVTDSDGNNNIKNQTLTVTNSAPTSNFTYSRVVVNRTITFNASTSIDLDGTIVNYTWNIDNTWSYGVEVNHTFDSYGTYFAYLNVTDDYGDYGELNRTITVKNLPPVINTSHENVTYIDVLYSVDYEGYDPENETLTWELSTDADWLDINTHSGRLLGTPRRVGNYEVEITVTDGENYVVENFILEVKIKAFDVDVLSKKSKDGAQVSYKTIWKRLPRYKVPVTALNNSTYIELPGSYKYLYFFTQEVEEVYVYGFITDTNYVRLNVQSVGSAYWKINETNLTRFKYLIVLPEPTYFEKQGWHIFTSRSIFTTIMVDVRRLVVVKGI